MIFSIREGVRQDLLSRGFPVTVAIGPESPTARGSDRQQHRIVIEHDTSGGDSFVSINARRVLARMVGYVATVYAFDPSAGATSWEHLIELQQIVDGVIVALRDWAQAQGSIVEFVGGRVLSADTLQGATTAAVAGYSLTFRMGRSVNRKDYDGSGVPTAELEGISTASRVSLDGDTFEEID